ncbi:preprotein translocase subunit YajC [Tessaracoccus sp. G1721]
MDLILMMIALFAVMYFLMIRPQQKRAKQHQEMQSGLSEGDRVLLTSGMFGTVAHVGERQLIIELAPGVEVTVLKGNVARKVGAEDEEFEFTDESAADELVEDATPELVEPSSAETTEGTVVQAEADAAADSFFQDRTAEPRAEDTK